MAIYTCIYHYINTHVVRIKIEWTFSRNEMHYNPFRALRRLISGRKAHPGGRLCAIYPRILWPAREHPGASLLRQLAM